MEKSEPTRVVKQKVIQNCTTNEIINLNDIHSNTPDKLLTLTNPDKLTIMNVQRDKIKKEQTSKLELVFNDFIKDITQKIESSPIHNKLNKFASNNIYGVTSQLESSGECRWLVYIHGLTKNLSESKISYLVNYQNVHSNVYDILKILPITSIGYYYIDKYSITSIQVLHIFLGILMHTIRDVSAYKPILETYKLVDYAIGTLHKNLVDIPINNAMLMVRVRIASSTYIEDKLNAFNPINLFNNTDVIETWGKGTTNVKIGQECFTFDIPYNNALNMFVECFQDEAVLLNTLSGMDESYFGTIAKEFKNHQVDKIEYNDMGEYIKNTKILNITKGSLNMFRDSNIITNKKYVDELINAHRTYLVKGLFKEYSNEINKLFKYF